ncbi:LysE family translocator [uncultured Marinobacter sp.]|uniref:LysE family translocator n=1 Tax=uncultured Marinobacter sp. TaxID=187379 RepID=UPI0030D7AE21
MELEIWYLYVGTVLILMSTPGPSQLLILSNSLSSGFPRSAYTAAGDLTANLIQMIIATVGLAYLIHSNENLITTIKWIGVGYLLYMGLISVYRKAPPSLEVKGEKRVRSSSSLYFQGFIVSALNPKAVIFFAALFPQFIDSTRSVVPQFCILSATYLLLDGLFLMTYAILASRLSNWLSRDNPLLRLGPGFLLIAVAVGLAMKTV